MKIVVAINPIFENMSNEGMHDFLITPAFQRLINRLALTDIYAEAYSQTAGEKRDSFSELLQPSFNYDLLGQFLSIMFTKKSQQFSEVITQLILEFLHWTNGFPEIKEILLDLKSLDVSEALLNTIRTQFRNIESDCLRQTQLIKNIATDRATGGAGNEKLYIRLRDSLTKNPSSSPYLPVIIANARNQQEFWTAIKTARSSYQERREFINDAFANLIKKLEANEQPVLVSVQIDEEYINNIWQKALKRIPLDPEAAITSSRALVETVCWHIIETKGLVFDEKMDLNKIYKTAVIQLNLSPEQHTQPVFKQILSGCQSVIEGLGSLRNKYSDAHGKGSKTIKPSARHAELAVNLAGSMCSFLLQSLKASLVEKS